MRGATRGEAWGLDSCAISIHAPHAGSDKHGHTWFRKLYDFNPRSPCGERLLIIGYRHVTHNFNPRSPCGERHSAFLRASFTSSFQSTLPMRGATHCKTVSTRFFLFQSTLPMRGATAYPIKAPSIAPNFNPRSPCGERPSTLHGRREGIYFNPRSPCGERPYR